MSARSTVPADDAGDTSLPFSELGLPVEIVTELAKQGITHAFAIH